MLGVLNQILLADKGESVCSAAQYDGYIKEIRGDVSSMMEIEKELVGDDKFVSE